MVYQEFKTRYRMSKVHQYGLRQEVAKECLARQAQEPRNVASTA